MNRSRDRIIFLGDILVGAIENDGYGSWFYVDKYHVPSSGDIINEPAELVATWFADIRETSEVADDPRNPGKWHVDLDLIAKGLGVIRAAELRDLPVKVPAWFPVQPLKDVEAATDPTWCETCHLTWDDGISTEMTPVPSGRCPFETFHESPVLHNKETGERLYMSTGMRKNIMLADRTNGEDGDLDVICYLAILECALYGAVVYA